MIRLILIILTVSVLCSCRSSIEAHSEKPHPKTHPRILGPIENLHKLDQDLYSGSEPSDLIHYQQLADLGINTVISVDAIAPNPGYAHRFGIQIVHFPIRYDGISDERAVQLAQAISQLEHPIYINCHHGKHRGPAALCVGAIGAGLITTQQAESFMTSAGTSPNYPGLWDAARSASMLDTDTNNADVGFPTHAPVPGFIDSMGKLDRLNDRLWDLADDNWQTPADHPDLSARAVSGRIYDLMRTMQTLPYFDIGVGQEMRADFEHSTKLARQIEIQIYENDHASVLTTLKAFSKSCKDCHTQFRN